MTSRVLNIGKLMREFAREYYVRNNSNGIIRISNTAVEEIISWFKDDLEEIVWYAVDSALSDGRKTVRVEDVIRAKDILCTKLEA